MINTCDPENTNKRKAQIKRKFADLQFCAMGTNVPDKRDEDAEMTKTLTTVLQVMPPGSGPSTRKQKTGEFNNITCSVFGGRQGKPKQKVCAPPVGFMPRAWLTRAAGGDRELPALHARVGHRHPLPDEQDKHRPGRDQPYDDCPARLDILLRQGDYGGHAPEKRRRELQAHEGTPAPPPLRLFYGPSPALLTPAAGRLRGTPGRQVPVGQVHHVPGLLRVLRRGDRADPAVHVHQRDARARGGGVRAQLPHARPAHGRVAHDGVHRQAPRGPDHRRGEPAPLLRQRGGPRVGRGPADARPHQEVAGQVPAPQPVLPREPGPGERGPQRLDVHHERRGPGRDAAVGQGHDAAREEDAPAGEPRAPGGSVVQPDLPHRRRTMCTTRSASGSRTSGGARSSRRATWGPSRTCTPTPSST